MSLNDISQALTPYPHCSLKVIYGAGHGVAITVNSDKLGELKTLGRNEKEAVDNMMALINFAKETK